jgi:hypothetical protein
MIERALKGEGGSARFEFLPPGLGNLPSSKAQ